MQDTISTDNQSADPKAEIKTRLANLLINRVTLSECLNVVKDACIQRSSDIIDKASEEDMKLILKDIEAFENPPEQQDANPSVETSGPSVGTSGPSVGTSGPSVGTSGPSVGTSGSTGSSGSGGQPDITPIGESGPMA